MAEDSTPYYRQSLEGCLKETVGPYGLSPAEPNVWIDKLRAPLAFLQAAYKRSKESRVGKECSEP